MSELGAEGDHAHEPRGQHDAPSSRQEGTPVMLDAPVTQLAQPALRHPLRLHETPLPGLRDDNN